MFFVNAGDESLARTRAVRDVAMWRIASPPLDRTCLALNRPGRQSSGKGGKVGRLRHNTANLASSGLVRIYGSTPRLLALVAASLMWSEAMVTVCGASNFVAPVFRLVDYRQ